jgi:hypothetical protein
MPVQWPATAVEFFSQRHMAIGYMEVVHAGYNDQEGGGRHVSARRNGSKVSRRRQARLDAPLGSGTSR